jgi:hypothetical protein
MTFTRLLVLGESHAPEKAAAHLASSGVLKVEAAPGRVPTTMEGTALWVNTSKGHRSGMRALTCRCSPPGQPGCRPCPAISLAASSFARRSAGSAKTGRGMAQSVWPSSSTGSSATRGAATRPRPSSNSSRGTARGAHITFSSTTSTHRLGPCGVHGSLPHLHRKRRDLRIDPSRRTSEPRQAEPGLRRHC